MKNVNTFWKREHETNIVPGKKSLTVPGLTMTISELLKNGDIDSISQKVRKRMIFGKRITINDLSDIDYYKGKLEHYNNLIRIKQKERSEEIVKDEEVSNSGSNMPKTNGKAVKSAKSVTADEAAA